MGTRAARLLARPGGAGTARTRGSRSSDVVAAVGGFAVAVGVAAAWIPLRAGQSNVEVALALVVVMTAAGVSGHRAAVVGSALGAALAFTFFDTQPFDRLTMARDPDVFTAVSLVVVGLITGELALRLARQRRSDRSVTRDLSRVREAASLLALGEELVVMIGAIAGKLVLVLDLQDCWFTAEELAPGTLVVDRDGALAAPGTGPASPPGTGPASPPGPGSAPDPAPAASPGGAPGPACPSGGGRLADIALPVWGLGQVLGHFVLRPTGPLGREQLLVAVTLADQVGGALAVQAPAVPLEADDVPAPNLRVVH